MRRIFTKNTATVLSNATATGLSVLARECVHCLCAGGDEGECASGTWRLMLSWHAHGCTCICTPPLNLSHSPAPRITEIGKMTTKNNDEIAKLILDEQDRG